ncbi:ExbD/TolR family protein [Caenimonas terrae]|uniref:ExbD/TolR family protein n=1 Tax=Caenimonas terrae TaxID=696074 RepID=A0ABW0N8X6_9BURK
MGIRIDSDESDAEVMVEMNTTPLIDVMLVLLVMLIITIPIQLHSVNLEMPSASAPPPPVEPKVVRIDVLPGGQLLWNGEPLAGRDALEARLAQAAGQADAPEIHLRPDRSAKYDTVAAVLASAQRHGLAKVGLVGSEQFLP